MSMLGQNSPPIADGTTISGHPLVANIGIGHAHISPFAYNAIVQGAWVLEIDTSQINNGAIKNTGAQNDELNWKVFMQIGTYTFRAIMRTHPDAAIQTWSIDGSVIGTIDGYSAADVYGQIKNITAIAITTAGLKTLSCKLATRNGAATNWKMWLADLTLFRTA